MHARSAAKTRPDPAATAVPAPRRPPSIASSAPSVQADPQPITHRARDKRPYRQRTLEELAQLIVRDRDADAVREVNDHRCVCRLAGGPPLRPAEFIAALNQTPRIRNLLRNDATALDNAYNDTIDMLCNLRTATHGDGRDCRNFYGMFLHRLAPSCSPSVLTAPPPSPPASAPQALEDELRQARVFQACLIDGHHWACLEASRKTEPTRSRYIWSCRGGLLTLWMPRSMNGRQRRLWLETNVPDADARRPGEQQRVQEFVNRLLPAAQRLPLDTLTDRPGHAIADLSRLIQIEGLAQAVAREKAAHLDAQRPSMRTLGASALCELVLCIFENLRHELHGQKELAERFARRPSSISLFGGSNWRLESGRRPPDLWINTAQVTAAVPAFAEAAREAGVWDRVQRILAFARPSPRKGDGHA